MASGSGVGILSGGITAGDAGAETGPIGQGAGVGAWWVLMVKFMEEPVTRECGGPPWR